MKTSHTEYVTELLYTISRLGIIDDYRISLERHIANRKLSRALLKPINEKRKAITVNFAITVLINLSLHKEVDKQTVTTMGELIDYWKLKE